jgi:septin family protein
MIHINTTLIVGPQRTGKSFLANALIEQDRKAGVRTELIEQPTREQVKEAKKGLLKREPYQVENFAPRHLIVIATDKGAVGNLSYDRLITLTGSAPALTVNTQEA